MNINTDYARLFVPSYEFKQLETTSQEWITEGNWLFYIIFYFFFNIVSSAKCYCSIYKGSR